MLLLTGSPCASAEEATDVLAMIKAENAATKTKLDDAKAKAEANAKAAQQIASETRAACEKFITLAEELAAAEKEALSSAKSLNQAKDEAAKLVEAAKVQKIQQPHEVVREVRSIAFNNDEPKIDESPAKTRARVVYLCKTILDKPAPMTTPQPTHAPAPPSSTDPRIVPFMRW